MTRAIKKIPAFVYGFERRAGAKFARLYYLLFLVLSFGAILAFRWNYQDPAFLTPMVEQTHFTDANFDIVNYKNYVEYFRGSAAAGPVAAPFRYRVLAPYLASLLPFSSMLALNVVNVVFHLLSMLYLALILKHLRCTIFECGIGVLLYVLSYPMLMYGAAGWNEPVSIALICAGIYHVLLQQRLVTLLIVILGSVNNEKIALLLVFLFVYEWKNKNFLYAGIAALCYAGPQLFIRASDLGLLPGSGGEPGGGYIWRPGVGYLYFNLVERWRNYPSFILTFGAVGLGTVSFLRQGLQRVYPEYTVFVAGFFGAIAVYAFSIVSAVGSGRILWYIYPFAIILTVKALQHNKPILSVEGA